MRETCTRILSARDIGARDWGHRDGADRIAGIAIVLHPDDDRRDRVQLGIVR